MPTPTAAAPRPNITAQQVQQQAQQSVQDKVNTAQTSLTQRAQDMNRTVLAQRSSSGVQPYQRNQQSSFEAPRPDFASRLQGLPAAQQASPFAGLHTLFGDIGKMGGAPAA